MSVVYKNNASQLFVHSHHCPTKFYVLLVHFYKVRDTKAGAPKKKLVDGRTGVEKSEIDENRASQ